MKHAAPHHRESPRPAFSAPSFAATLRDVMRDVQQKKLAQLQAILDANAKGDRCGIVTIVESLMEDERCCA